MATTRRKRNKRQNRKRYYYCQRLKRSKRFKQKRMFSKLSLAEIYKSLLFMLLTVSNWILIQKSPSLIEIILLLLGLPVTQIIRFQMDK